MDSADLDITVPDEFAVILKIALSKMVAAKCLNPEFINLDFWRRIPNKFRGIRLYEATKTKKVQFFFKRVIFYFISNNSFNTGSPGAGSRAAGS